MKHTTERIVLVALAVVGIVVVLGPLNDEVSDLSTGGQVAALVAILAAVWLAERVWKRSHR